MLDWFFGRKRREELPLGLSPEQLDCLDEVIRLGSLLLHDSEATQHFLAVGATGSGKTTMLKLLLQSVLPRVQPGSDTRLLLNDAKQDSYSMLKGIAPDVEVHIFHPFDARCVAWDVASDINEPRLALEMSAILIPEKPDGQPFFPDAASDLLANTMVSFMLRGLDWTLADVLRALSNEEDLRRVLQACPETSRIVERYYGDPRLLKNIIATLGTKLKKYEAPAFAWERAERRISLADWLQSESVLLLGNSEVSRQAINAINGCIFRCLCNLILDQSESQTRRTFVMLDEVSEAGKLDGLVSLCKLGRSKGASIFLALQCIASMRNTALYGPEETIEILSQMGHVWIGRLGDSDTATWASDLVGDQEIREVTISHTYSHEESTTHQEQFVTRKTVLPAEFMSIPPCNLENGLSGYYISRVTGVYYDTLPGPELFQQDLISNAEDVDDYISRPVEDQLFRDWTEEQRRLFAPEPKDTSEQSDRSDQNPPDIDLSVLDDLDDL